MRLSIEAILDYWISEPTDILLAIEAAPLDDQRLIEDQLVIDGAGTLTTLPAEEGIGRRTWMEGEGRWIARYTAIVDVERAPPALETLGAVPRHSLPSETVRYLWPSRYCESDRLEAFVTREFGALEGGAKIAAMADWVHAWLAYCPGSTDETTTALDVLSAREGVCRDYAHLLVSMARASGIPARCVSAYAWQLNPPDFHAVVEVWLDGAWHLVDPTRLAPVEGLVRIGVGRDAVDIAFMTAFGTAELNEQRVSVSRLD